MGFCCNKSNKPTYYKNVKPLSMEVFEQRYQCDNLFSDSVIIDKDNQ